VPSSIALTLAQSTADDLGMRQRFLLLLVLVCAVAAADLAVKELKPTDPDYFHPRSQSWAFLSIAVVSLSVLLTRLPSRLVAVASGILAGGVTGNLVTAALNDGRVANPFVVTTDDSVLAFNLADVFVLGGIVLLTAALVEVTIRHRHLLPRSTVPARAARRLRRRCSCSR